MSYAAEIGRIGERMVADFLRSKGYIILRCNYRCPFGEIDVVAENRDTLAFVEVKTRAEGALVAPEDAVNPAKQIKIIKTAYDFLARLPYRVAYRFDVAEVIYVSSGDDGPHFSLNYIKNAFSAEALGGIAQKL